MESSSLVKLVFRFVIFFQVKTEQNFFLLNAVLNLFYRTLVISDTRKSLSLMYHEHFVVS